MTAPSPTSPAASAYASRPWLRHYDYWVRPDLVYPERPLTEILDAVVVDLPDQQATAFLGGAMTFQRVKDRADRLATALGGFGIVKGDRVGIMLPNCPQYIIAAFAVLRHGAIIVNINPTYTARELLAVANDSGIKILAPASNASSSRRSPSTPLPPDRLLGSTAQSPSPIWLPTLRPGTWCAPPSDPTTWPSSSTRAGQPARRRGRC